MSGTEHHSHFCVQAPGCSSPPIYKQALCCWFHLEAGSGTEIPLATPPGGRDRPFPHGFCHHVGCRQLGSQVSPPLQLHKYHHNANRMYISVFIYTWGRVCCCILTVLSQTAVPHHASDVSNSSSVSSGADISPPSAALGTSLLGVGVTNGAIDEEAEPCCNLAQPC